MIIIIKVDNSGSLEVNLERSSVEFDHLGFFQRFFKSIPESLSVILP